MNHEIYGGIYSQMIFGESSRSRPASTLPEISRRTAARWAASAWRILGGARGGPETLINGTKFAAGPAKVGIFFAGKVAGNAG